ncbi:MAG: FtsQ-type POTRA domain-containing protein [Chroococcidiopsidaceae cyanobacterium CP_BM_ER_R8_30]|nr:FtsQ-type POTRA domain-containing protein [Chroococcidiopsidaceae cyanobacterium CP_BM_ER_R8_30]
MTSIPSGTRSRLSQRRHPPQLKPRVELFQTFWRTLVILGLSSGLAWEMTRPIWVLRQSSQIVILGNHLLSAQAIRSLLPLSYPKSLLKVEPAALAHVLVAQPAIANANVTRQLFPPGITVQVRERVPVAIALRQGSLDSDTTSIKASMGLLDEDGVWIPLRSYLALSRTSQLPSLKVIGSPEQYHSYWAQIYQTVIHSPIKISEIDCQDPANLMLKTELGIVHLGPYSSQLAEQLDVLARMRQLPTHVSLSQIAYINLKDPRHPLVQMKQTMKPISADSPQL